MRDVTRTPAEVVIEVAGRANLIGDHTDYQHGLALPFALDGLVLRLEGRRRGEGVVLTSALDGRTHAVTADGPGVGWGRYAAAVLRALRDAGQTVLGLEATISSSLPAGAGLASSAALELAVAVAVCEDELAPLPLARICQRAESEYVGVPCGLLDQLAIAAGRAGHATLLDFQDLSVEQLPWPDELGLAIVHSGVSRALGDSAYATRRRETEQAAALLGVATLRELGPDAELATLPEPLRRRVRHVLSENARVESVVGALRDGDSAALGAALTASHRSLAEDFDVSTPELDLLVELLSSVAGAAGARLTGGGFGGCAIALFEGPPDIRALDAALRDYERRSGRTAGHWITRPGTGIAWLRSRR